MSFRNYMSDLPFGHQRCTWCQKQYDFLNAQICVPKEARYLLDTGDSTKEASGLVCSQKCKMEVMSAYNAENIQQQQGQRLKEEETLRQNRLQEQRDKSDLEKKRQKFYNRECPMCAETVKAKALLCKECGHKFEDGQQYRDRIKEWEDRAEPFGLDPWDEQAIIQKEYEQTPEYKAEQAEMSRQHDQMHQNHLRELYEQNLKKQEYDKWLDETKAKEAKNQFIISVSWRLIVYGIPILFLVLFILVSN